MKLFYSAQSPFARKARIVILEKGLSERVELCPSDRATRLTEIGDGNPIVKVPTLFDDDGECWFDSPVICEYLDSLSPEPRLFPEDGKARWKALRLQALGDGGMDDAVKLAYEGQRPAGARSPYWMDRWRHAVEGALGQLESEADDLAAGYTIGQIAVGCFLGFLDRRMTVGDWRAGREELQLWYEEFAARPSSTETPHPEN